MKICFTQEGWEDYQYWIETDRNALRRVNALIEDIRSDLFRGIGKPELLKGDLSGWWSRRIMQDHRLVYAVIGLGQDQRLMIAACRYH